MPLSSPRSQTSHTVYDSGSETVCSTLTAVDIWQIVSGVEQSEEFVRNGIHLGYLASEALYFRCAIKVLTTLKTTEKELFRKHSDRIAIAMRISNIGMSV